MLKDIDFANLMCDITKDIDLKDIEIPKTFQEYNQLNPVQKLVFHLFANQEEFRGNDKYMNFIIGARPNKLDVFLLHDVTKNKIFASTHKKMLLQAFGITVAKFTHSLRKTKENKRGEKFKAYHYVCTLIDNDYVWMFESESSNKDRFIQAITLATKEYKTGKVIKI